MQPTPHSRRPAPAGDPATTAAPLAAVTLLALAAIACDPGAPATSGDPGGPGTGAGDDVLRVALFNVKELSAAKIRAAAAGAASDEARQVLAAVTIVRRIRPDILVLQEIDQGPDDDPAAPARELAALLADGTVERGEPLAFDTVFAAPSNTGRLSGLDLDGDGRVATEGDRGTRPHGNDSFGFGTYPGQYAMAVLSRVAVDPARVRTFQLLPWHRLPRHHIGPALPAEGDVRQRFRLSSKSHWIVPVQWPGADNPLHLLVSHPTPPGFDGAEDRNGRRNFDEIGLWARLLDNEAGIADDRGLVAPIPDPVLVVGDLNARPDSDESRYDGMPAIDQLLGHPRLRDPADVLVSRGGVLHAVGSGDADPPNHPERSTAVFGRGVRIDYLLPSRDLEVVDGGVFWPDPAQDPEAAAVAEAASDHRLVWIDLARR